MSDQQRVTPSLQTRVAIAAAVGAALIAIVLVAVSFWAVKRDEYQRLDAQVARLEVVAATVPVSSDENALTSELGDADFVATIRRGKTIMFSTPTTVPALASGTKTVTIDTREYRVQTVIRDRVRPFERISAGLPLAPATQRIATRRRWAVFIALLSVLAAGALGWLLGGRAAKPFRDLATGLAHGDPSPGAVAGTRGAVEAREIAASADALLHRLDDEHRKTTQALGSARDFASVAAHELRSPLTSMGTDLDLLTGEFALSASDRDTISERLSRNHRRVIDTLAALEALARGQLADRDQFMPLDIAELIDRVAHDAREASPDTQVLADTPDSLPGYGFDPGLRLALENAVSNAIRHGQATTVTMAAVRDSDGTVDITIDDNGRGLPAAERGQVLARFARGSTAVGTGSGIGLALIAEQARLHGGEVHLEDSPLGGLRVRLSVPLQGPQFH